MTTIIIPGGSIKNKTWAEDLAANFSPEIDSQILHWSWWENNQVGGLNLAVETPRFLPLVPSEPYFILAKSIGTYFIAATFPKLPHPPEKIIFCGLPLHDISDEDKKAYQNLASYPADKIAVFQNEADPHGSFPEAKEFLSKINPQIPVTQTPDATHDYPFPDLFKRYFLSK